MSKKLEELLIKEKALEIVENELTPLLKDLVKDAPAHSKPHEQILEQAFRFHNLGQYQEALPLFIELAEHGSDIGAEYAAQYYFEGKGVEQSYEKAAQFYLVGQKNGSLYSRFRVGYLMLYGLGLTQNIEKGLTIIEETAFMRIDEAVWCLVDLYQEGKYVEKDLEVADFWRSKVEYNIGKA